MRMTYTRVSFVVVIVLGLWTGSLLSACAPELVSGEEHTHNSDGGTQDGPPKTRVVPGESVVTTDLGDGVTQLQINSSDSQKWIYITFAKDNPVEVTDPMQSNDWELGFQRFQIKSNSGVSGKGGVEVAIVDDKTFDEIEYAPKEGYLTDKEDGDDEDKDPDFSFLVQDGWYAYNPTDHTLSARKRVYVVKTTKGEYVKVMMLGYYDKNGNSGFPTLKWAKIKAPKETTTPKAKTENKDLGDGVTQTKVDATDKESWVYFSFSYARDIEVKEPTQSTDWDIAFQRSSVKVNGGISGKGGVEVAILKGEDFDVLKTAPKDGYVTDAVDGSDEGTEPDLVFNLEGGWYQYDPSTHILAPKDQVYVLKQGSHYYKMKILSYYNDEKKSGYPTFKWAKIDPPQ